MGTKKNDGVHRFCRSWLASEDGRKRNASFKDAFAGKPAPTGHVWAQKMTVCTRFCRSWLASEGGRKRTANFKDAFAGKGSEHASEVAVNLSITCAAVEQAGFRTGVVLPGLMGTARQAANLNQWLFIATR